MNLFFKSKCSGFFSFITQPIYMPVRYRYYAEKIARGPCAKKFGYKEKLFQGGLLPRLKDAEAIKKLPIYQPANSWSVEKATLGQNDYIDILGGGKLRPADVSYNVPKWLRGRKGNELQLLLLKQKVFGNTQYVRDHPAAWYNIKRRVRYLYRFLNYKTKTNFMKK